MDETFHIFDYDLNINGAIMSNENNAPMENQHFKWCSKVGKSSWIWLNLTPQNSRKSIGQIGSWYTEDEGYMCLNSIAIYEDKYHQIAADNSGKSRIEVPTSYRRNDPVVIEIEQSVPMISIETPLGLSTARLSENELHIALLSGSETNARIVAQWDIDTMQGN